MDGDHEGEVGASYLEKGRGGFGHYACCEDMVNRCSCCSTGSVGVMGWRVVWEGACHVVQAPTFGHSGGNGGAGPVLGVETAGRSVHVGRVAASSMAMWRRCRSLACMGCLGPRCTSVSRAVP